MDKDTIADLKQFIEATVSQQLTGQTEELREGLRKDIHDDIKEDIDRLDDKLTKKIDDLSEAVGEAMHTSNEETDRQLKDHEHRIVRLEKRTA